MQSQNRLLDDLARVASGALGVASGVREEVEGRLRQQFERILQQMDLVTREEFEAVQAMAAKARDEQEALAERVAALETRLAAVEGGGKSTRSRAAKSGGTRRKASGGTRRKSSSTKSGTTGSSGSTGG